LVLGLTGHGVTLREGVPTRLGVVFGKLFAANKLALMKQDMSCVLLMPAILGRRRPARSIRKSDVNGGEHQHDEVFDRAYSEYRGLIIFLLGNLVLKQRGTQISRLHVVIHRELVGVRS